MVVVLVLLWRSMSLAQSNDVYSFWTSASTPLTGYRVAVVSASPIWVVGSAQNRFGIEECRYWTDSAGRAIPWPATRVKQPGDKQHCYTRFRLGQASLSVPLPPIDLAFLAGFGALVFGCIAILHFARGRPKTSFTDQGPSDRQGILHTFSRRSWIVSGSVVLEIIGL